MQLYTYRLMNPTVTPKAYMTYHHTEKRYNGLRKLVKDIRRTKEARKRNEMHNLWNGATQMEFGKSSH